MDETLIEQQHKKHNEESTLRRNQERQHQLEEELIRLKTEEEVLTDSIATREYTREQLDVERERTCQEIEEWKAQIEELMNRTHTALDIVHRMESMYMRTCVYMPAHS